VAIKEGKKQVISIIHFHIIFIGDFLLWLQLRFSIFQGRKPLGILVDWMKTQFHLEVDSYGVHICTSLVILRRGLSFKDLGPKLCDLWPNTILKSESYIQILE